MRWPTFGSMKWVMRHRTKEMRAGSRLFGLPLLLFLCLFCFELNSILYLGGVCVLVCYRMYSRVPCLSLCFVLRVFFALCLSTCFCFLCFLVYVCLCVFLICFRQYFFLMVLVCCGVQKFRLPTCVWIRSLAFLFARNDSVFILSLSVLQFFLFARTWYIIMICIITYCITVYNTSTMWYIY